MFTNFKYKKLLLLGLFYIIAFSSVKYLTFLAIFLVQKLGIFSAFIMGYLYSFSFTSAISTIMIYESHYSSWLFALIGSLGAVLADLTVYKFLKIGLKKELQSIVEEPWFVKILKIFPFLKNVGVRRWLGVLAIALPMMPDEAGVLLLSNSRLSKKDFLLLVFVFNFLAIYIISNLR